MSKLSQFIREKRYTFKHKIYGKCYMPLYNRYLPLDSKIPEIYNKYGQKLDVFFLRDNHFNHLLNWTGGGITAPNDYFIWDRYNFGLKTHFYTGESIMQTMGKPDKKFAWLLEPYSVFPKPYLLLKNNKSLGNEFTNIITHNERILNDYANAKFIYSLGIWCYFEEGDTLCYDDKKFQTKEKGVSMIVSGKTFTKLHLIRNALADKLKHNNKVDIFGKYVGKPIKYKSLSLDKYRYQIVIENEINAYYFTEKVVDCFISMCVPIYMGASKISEFFNTDGIIEIAPKDIDNIDEILKQCNEQNYKERLTAIIDNYHRVLEYINGKNFYKSLFEIKELNG